jgi:hypothetical protein
VSETEREEGDSFGRGNKAADRSDLATVLDGVAQLATEWRPWPAQEHMLGATAGIIMSTGALGSGKSEPGAFMLLRWALRNPRREDGRPTKWYAIGPDFGRLRSEQMPKILEHARRIVGVDVVKRVTVGMDPKIVLIHDQQIVFRSASDADRLRGHEIDGFWIDEAQLVSEEAFRIAVSRVRSSRKFRIVITCSPEDVPSWNWHLISGESVPHNELRRTLIETGTGFFCYRWRSEDNLANQGEVLASVRAVMDTSSPIVAAQELEGRYPGTHEAPTSGALDFTRAFVGTARLRHEDTRAAVLGVDLGMSEDFTWFTILSRTGYVLAMERFNASTPGFTTKGFYPKVEELIVGRVLDWQIPVVKIDSAMHGVGTVQHLERELAGRAKVVGYRTSSPGRKAEAIEALGGALARLSIRIPSTWIDPTGGEHRVEFVDYLRKELSELVVTQKDGYRTFDHPSGGHDDGVVSLALAFQGLESRPEVDLSPWFKKNKFQVPGSKWATPFGPGFNLGGMRPFPPTRPPGR